jgi:hypothetical protein
MDEIVYTGNGEEKNTPLLGYQAKREFDSNTPLTRIEVIIIGLALVNNLICGAACLPHYYVKGRLEDSGWIMMLGYELPGKHCLEQYRGTSGMIASPRYSAIRSSSYTACLMYETKLVKELGFIRRCHLRDLCLPCFFTGLPHSKSCFNYRFRTADAPPTGNPFPSCPFRR